MKLAVFCIALLVAGCSSPDKFARYADCTLPVVRDAGMGVMVDGCAAWSFGPSRAQAAAFNANRR